MITLIRDCEATLIPSGEEVLLQKDSNYSVKQALGESVTLANEIGLFRVAKINLDALGKEGEALREQLEKQAEDGIRDQPRSRGLGDVYKRQLLDLLIISEYNR